VAIQTAGTGCMLHVFNGKRGDVGKRNAEKLKQENGNHNSETRVGERKIDDTICSVPIMGIA